MKIIPIDSKQIDYVEYDDLRSYMIAHFMSGELRQYSVTREEYAALLFSSNKYDCFVSMTAGRLEAAASEPPCGIGALGVTAAD